VICEDGWNNRKVFPNPHDHLYHDDPWVILNSQSKKLAANINLSGSPYWLHKWKVRHHMQQALAKQFKTPQIFLNLVGSQDQLIFNGRSFIYNSRGQMVLEMKAYAEDSVTLDL